MKQKGFSQYFVVIVLLLLGIVLINAWKKNNVEYTRAELVQDLEDGDIEEVVIHPNAQGPTGYLDVTFASGQEKTLYATDISELEKLVRGNGIEPRVLDIQRESIFLTSILPTLIIVVAAAFFFIMMNAQNAGGGSSARMMNFGKSRAKLANVGDDKVTLKDVAGLREEKEELEEIIDFLEPAKYTKVGARIPKGVLLEGPPEPVKPYWQRQLQAKQMYRFSVFPVRISWKCLSVSALPV